MIAMEQNDRPTAEIVLEDVFFHYSHHRDHENNELMKRQDIPLETCSSQIKQTSPEIIPLETSSSQIKPTAADIVLSTQELNNAEADNILQDEDDDENYLEQTITELPNAQLPPSTRNNVSEDSSNILENPKTAVLKKREFLKLCSSTTKLNENELTRFVELVTDESVDVNVKFPDRWKPLLKLCRYYQHDNLIYLVRLLRDKGADLKARTSDGYNVLQLVCFHQLGNVGLIHLIQVFTESADIDVDEETPDGWNPLTYLCVHYKKENLIDVIRPLIKSGANLAVNLKDRGAPFISLLGWLFLAYEHGNFFYLCHLFISNGAVNRNNINRVINSKNWSDKARQVFLPSGTKTVEGTLLGLLVSKRRHNNMIDLVRPLLENGANVNCRVELEIYVEDKGVTLLNTIKCSQILPTLFYPACTYKYENGKLEELVQLFLENGADANSKSESILSANRRHLEISKYGVLHILCSTHIHDNLIHLLRPLIQEGASVNAMMVETRRYMDPFFPPAMRVEVFEANPLHLLCMHYKHDNLIDIVRLFIENGIDVNAKGRKGENALHLLCENYKHENLFDLVFLLKENNIDLKAKTNEGYTASYILQTKNPAKDKMGRVIDFLPQDDPSTNCRLM